MTRQPILFLSHGGGPCFFLDSKASPMSRDMDKNSAAADFFRSLLVEGKYINQRPKAILMVSAHWEESKATVSFQDKGTSLIYDYYGFPEETYAPNLVYPVPTDLNVADRVSELLTKASIPNQQSNRGYDHGVFIPLKLAFPAADIPIVQLSINSNLDEKYHVKLGEAIEPLRHENVLIICSGSTTHNLKDIMSYSGGDPLKMFPWVFQFSDWLQRTLEISRHDKKTIGQSKELLIQIEEKSPQLRKNHPRTEHLIPLHVAFGAAYHTIQNEESTTSSGDYIEDQNCDNMESNNLFGRQIYRQIVNGALCLDSYIFE